MNPNSIYSIPSEHGHKEMEFDNTIIELITQQLCSNKDEDMSSIAESLPASYLTQMQSTMTSNSIANHRGVWSRGSPGSLFWRFDGHPWSVVRGGIERHIVDTKQRGYVTVVWLCDDHLWGNVEEDYDGKTTT